MAMKTVLKQPEKNAPRDPGEKGWSCYYCGKEGHLKWDALKHLRCPGCMSGLQRTTLEERLPQRHRSQGSDSQDNQD